MWVPFARRLPLASLSPDLARQYGHVESKPGLLEEKLKAAIAAKDWTLAASISAELANLRPSAG